MAWYRAGTVKLESGSDIVIGSATKWTLNLFGIGEGQALVVDGKRFEVMYVDNDTKLRLATKSPITYDGPYVIETSYAGTGGDASRQIMAAIRRLSRLGFDWNAWLTSDTATVDVEDNYGNIITIPTYRIQAQDWGPLVEAAMHTFMFELCISGATVTENGQTATIRPLRDTQDHADQALEVANATKDSVDVALADFTVQMTNLAQEMQANVQHVNSVAATMQEQADDLAAKFLQLQTTVEEQTTQVNKNKDDIAALDVRVTKNTTDISDLQTKSTSNETSIANLTSSLSEVKTTASNAKTQSETNAQAITTINGKIDTVNSTLESMTLVDEQQSATLVDHSTRIGTLETQRVSDMQQTNAALRNKVDTDNGFANDMTLNGDTTADNLTVKTKLSVGKTDHKFHLGESSGSSMGLIYDENGNIIVIPKKSGELVTSDQLEVIDGKIKSLDVETELKAKQVTATNGTNTVSLQSEGQRPVVRVEDEEFTREVRFPNRSGTLATLDDIPESGEPIPMATTERAGKVLLTDTITNDDTVVPHSKAVKTAIDNALANVVIPENIATKEDVTSAVDTAQQNNANTYRTKEDSYSKQESDDKFALKTDTVTVADATNEVKGVAKLYDALGENTDGSVNQKVVTETFVEHAQQLNQINSSLPFLEQAASDASQKANIASQDAAGALAEANAATAASTENKNTIEDITNTQLPALSGRVTAVEGSVGSASQQASEAFDKASSHDRAIVELQQQNQFNLASNKTGSPVLNYSEMHCDAYKSYKYRIQRSISSPSAKYMDFELIHAPTTNLETGSHDIQMNFRRVGLPGLSTATLRFPQLTQATMNVAYEEWCKVQFGATMPFMVIDNSSYFDLQCGKVFNIPFKNIYPSQPANANFSTQRQTGFVSGRPFFFNKTTGRKMFVTDVNVQIPFATNWGSKPDGQLSSKFMIRPNPQYPSDNTFKQIGMYLMGMQMDSSQLDMVDIKGIEMSMSITCLTKAINGVTCCCINLSPDCGYTAVWVDDGTGMITPQYSSYRADWSHPQNITDGTKMELMLSVEFIQFDDCKNKRVIHTQ